MEGIETFDNPLLQEVKFNSDGTLKASGKQQVKFYRKKVLDFKAKPLMIDGEVQRDANNKVIFDIDPKTGLPKKEAFEKVVTMVRVETKGDTNIKDDVADEVAKRQFYRQYKYFMDGRIPDGHPLEDFEFLQPATMMELHLLGIHVIEQLAEMGDLECGQVTSQSGFEVRDIAQQWIRINSPQGQSMRLSTTEVELKKANDKIKELESQLGGARSYRAVVNPENQVTQEPEVSTVEISVDEMKKRGRPRKYE